MAQLFLAPHTQRFLGQKRGQATQVLISNLHVQQVSLEQFPHNNEFPIHADIRQHPIELDVDRLGIAQQFEFLKSILPLFQQIKVVPLSGLASAREEILAVQRVQIAAGVETLFQQEGFPT